MTLLPNSKGISFESNTDEKDDGNLIKFISESGGMDTQQATNVLAKFIRELEAELKTGSTYDMYGFGKFIKEDSGSIRFESVIKPEEKTPKIIKPEGKIIKGEQKITETKTPSPEKPVETPKEETPPKTENKKPEAHTTFRRSDVENKKKEDNKVEVEKEKGKVESKVEVIKKSIDSNKSDSDILRKNSQNKVKKPKKSKAWIFILILVILLGGLGVFGYLFKQSVSSFIATNLPSMSSSMLFSKDNDNSFIDEPIEGDASTEDLESDEDENEDEFNEEDAEDFSDTENESDDKSSIDDVNEEASEVESEPIENIEPEVESIPADVPSISTPSNGNYHIIANVFKVESNANDYVSEMTGKGYSSKIVCTKNEHHFVSIGSYSDLKSAQAELNSVSSDFSGAWVYKYPR